MNFNRGVVVRSAMSSQLVAEDPITMVTAALRQLEVHFYHSPTLAIPRPKCECWHYQKFGLGHDERCNPPSTSFAVSPLLSPLRSSTEFPLAQVTHQPWRSVMHRITLRSLNSNLA